MGCSTGAGGKGGGNASSSKLSSEIKQQISNEIATHTQEQNDRAERNYRQSIEKEKNIIDNVDKYIRIGYIQSKNDAWFQEHLRAYNEMQARYQYFQQERKRQRR